jgi:hypothetical protein
VKGFGVWVRLPKTQVSKHRRIWAYEQQIRTAGRGLGEHALYGAGVLTGWKWTVRTGEEARLSENTPRSKRFVMIKFAKYVLLTISSIYTRDGAQRTR